MYRDSYFYVTVGLVFLYGLAIFLLAANSARQLKDAKNIDL